MELVVIVSAVVMFVLMVTVGVVDTRGTTGSTAVSLGCKTGSVETAGTLPKSFDCHCGVEPEKLLQRKK